MFSIINILFIVLGLFLIYYLYRYLFTGAANSGTVIVSSQRAGNVPPSSIKSFPKPYEGGDYSVNTWIYVSSFNNINTRKHILEIQGENFSTLLVALGSFKNSLVVRTHYSDPIEEFQNPATPYMSGIVDRVRSIVRGQPEGFASGKGSGSGSGSGDGSHDTGSYDITDYDADDDTEKINNTPGSGDKPGNLSKSSVVAMFKPMAADDSLLTAPAVCDIPSIDLQRWTMVTVVLSGKVIDVYIDGKLNRSCAAPSYFKVDPTKELEVRISDRGGFDGYLGNTMVGSYSMTPDEIYRTYLSGPNGASLDPIAWVSSILTGAKFA